MSFPIRVLVVDEDSTRAERLVAACVESVDGEVIASVAAGGYPIASALSNI
jgi:hypothetical protein